MDSRSCFPDFALLLTIETIPIAVLPPTSQPTAPEPTASVLQLPTYGIYHEWLTPLNKHYHLNQKLLFLR
jgi:hypothetical protein